MSIRLVKISYAVILAFAGFSCFSVFAQVSLPENSYYHFEGSIGKDKTVILDLHKLGDSLTGTYYSQHNGVLHYFYGKIYQTVRFSVVEKNGDSLSGEFASSNKLKGKKYKAGSTDPAEFTFTETDYFGSLSFLSYNNSRTYNFADKPLFPKYTVALSYLFPEKNISKIAEDSVQDYIIGYYFGKNAEFNSADIMLKNLSNRYYNSYASHYKTNGYSYNSPILQWYTKQNIQVLFNENFILTFCISQNSSSWQPEPDWEKIYFVINLKTGSKITADDIFMEGYRDKLSRLLTEKLQKQFNINTSLQAEGFYRKSINRYDNLLITREGVGFHYNPGDIAPWIFGEIDLFFKFSELKDILLTKGIVYTLVQ